MSRFFMSSLSLGLIVVALLAMAVRGEGAATAPIQAADRLFDQTNPETLGLRTVKAEHRLLYRATEDSYKFCHEQNIAVFKDTLYVMWSNGIQHESHNGQRIMYSRSSDGLTMVDAGRAGRRSRWAGSAGVYLCRIPRARRYAGCLLHGDLRKPSRDR